MAIQSHLPAFLLTRPKAQSLRFAEELRQAVGDVRVTVSPLITPVLLSPDLPSGRFDAVIFTSETAVAASRTIVEAGYKLPGMAYCVGDRTAAAARMQGMTALSAGADAVALIALIMAQKTPGRLLHLRGYHSRGDVAGKLTSAGIETFGVAIYRQEAQSLTSGARDMLQRQGDVAVPLFSPRSAALFMAELQSVTLGARLTLFSLSPAVDAELAENLPASRHVASAPDVGAMIALIAQRYAAGGAS